MQRDFSLNLVKDITHKKQNISIIMAEACRVVPDLGIPEAEPIYVSVRKLAARVCDTWTELAKFQLELNLKISEL